jgi:hypothetical protein
VGIADRIAFGTQGRILQRDGGENPRALEENLHYHNHSSRNLIKTLD